MKTAVHVIVDNTPGAGLPGEWGLCLLVEYGEQKILVDSGSSDLFADNLEKLGFHIADVDFAVLSHAHYDHANGFPRFFQENPSARLYLRETAEANCYARKLIFRKYIGIPRNLIRAYADRIEFVSGDYTVSDGVYLIPHKTAHLDRIGKRENMFIRTPDGWRTDSFSHEQSLVLDTEKGLLIINSCSHGGAANIIREIKSTFPDRHIYGLIGGLHLFNKSDEEIRRVAKEIADTGIDCICTGHCTKDRAFHILKNELGARLSQLQVGLKIEV